MVGLAYISLFVLIAVFSPFIRPDQSQDANQQNLLLSKQKPGFEVQVLSKVGHKDGFLQRWIHDGNSGLTEEWAFTEITFRKDTVSLKLYDPSGFSEWRTIQILGVKANMTPEVFTRSIQDYKISNKRFWFGTDKYGRDLLSRLISGSRISIAVGFVAVLISLILGITLGASAGYFGGKLDQLISWIINVVWSIPTLLMVIAITLAFGKGFWQVFIAVGLTMWVEVARVVRGQYLILKELEYVQAAKVLGFSHARIIFKHILPNAIGPIIVISAANFAAAILIEAGLSFLGIGAQIPTPSWGNMIKEHYALITTNLAYLAILPGVLIMSLVLAFMLVGNAVRDALDVKTSS